MTVQSRFPLSAYSLGRVVVNVFLDGFLSGGLVNLGNGDDLGPVVKCFGFLGNRFIYQEKRKGVHISSKNH